MATTMTDATTARTPDRAQSLRCELDRACLDGSVVLAEGEVSDLLVDDQGKLRELLPVVSCWAADRGMPTLVYSLAHGLRAFDYPGGPQANVPGGIAAATPPTSALDITFGSMQAAGQPTTLVIDHVEGLLPDGQPTGNADTARIREQILTRATDPVWRSQGHRLLLVARTGTADQRIARHPGVVVARLGLPELSERQTALRLMIDSPSHRLWLDQALSFDDAVRRSGGLRLDLISRLRLQTGNVAPLTTAQLVEAKSAAIRALAGDSLTLYDQDLDLDADVAGLPQVRRYLAERQAKDDYSMRLILVGPPGNGKNWVARAIAHRMGVPAVELGRILGRYVGESEENLDRAIEAIEAIAPVVVIMDEIDQGPLSRRGESHGTDGAAVNANLRARLFGWLGDVGDRRGISVVGMTNRAELLDEAAADRFTFIPILHPTPFEAAQIMAIQARREGLDFDGDAAALALASSTRAFSGRQGVRLLDSAQTHALERNSRRIAGQDTEAAMLDALSEVGHAEKLQSLLAIAYTTWNRHLPWNAARYLGDASAEPPAYLKPYVKPDGTIDRPALDRAIDELRARA